MTELKRLSLRAKPSLCTVCQRCALTCAFRHHGAADPGRSAVRIIHDLPNSLAVKIRFCIQCPEEQCARACPKRALARNDVGIVLLDKQKCDTCQGQYLCAKACRYGSIYTHPSVKYPIKCDVCGGQALCVSQCPVGALQL